MESLSKDDLTKYKTELEQQAVELYTQLTEVRGVILWLKQMIERIK